jgi:MFS family permease
LKKFAAIILIITTFITQLSSGINYVVFPLTLQEQGYSITLIGVAMSFEILAIILLSKYISLTVKYLGVILTLLITSVIRSVVIYFLGFNDDFIIWLLGIFIYGLTTSMLLVVVQTWLNMIDVGKLKGLFLGLYSSALSLGIAAGPILLHYIVSDSLKNIVSIIIPFLPLAFLIFIIKQKPVFSEDSKVRTLFVFKHAKVVLLSAFVGGVCFFGLPSFLTIYGIENGLSSSQASLLLTMFMIGSVSIGALISWMSSFIDTLKIIYICCCFSVVCAVFLSLAVYSSVEIAYVLLVIWGGCMGGIYASSLEYIGGLFRKEDQISANTTFVLMDSLGGFIGLFAIGLSMEFIGGEGLTYVIVLFSVCYLVYITKEFSKKI